MSTVVTATAGGDFTYSIISGTAQQVIDSLATLKQNKPVFKVLSMAFNGTNLSVLIEYLA